MTCCRLSIFVAVVSCTTLPSSPADAQTRPEAETQSSPATERNGAQLEWFRGNRYRLTPSDVVELSFPYVPEFNQVLTVQPDGYVTLMAVGDLRVQGHTLPELRALLVQAYAPILRDPVITVLLKEFEKPSFVVLGEVKQPGKFELRGGTSLTQALAVAGGLTDMGKASEVVLFRRFSEDVFEVKQVDVKDMFARRNLSEDPLLRPGDAVFVPKSALARIGRFISRPQLGLYLNPFQFWP